MIKLKFENDTTHQHTYLPIYIWKDCFSEKSGPTPALFGYFGSYSNTNFTEKSVDFSGISTRIVGIEGEHADHLTTTPAQKDCFGEKSNAWKGITKFYYLQWFYNQCSLVGTQLVICTLRYFSHLT